MPCMSVVRFLCCKIFSASFLITFVCPEIAASVNVHVAFPLSWIVMSEFIVADDYVGSHSLVADHDLFRLILVCTCSNQHSLSSFIHIFLHVPV